ncbi:uncharacterized protein LOC121642782 [Melanotaenia boesemani]|uniref:uncharacterized protein LOC121642782 n=1 Tax=Melanotaenia boesemani TaxID=1250792 RepID=UPI001C058285|nr:uncharacterized protein LOC121642782 [Melanotaenia boesemani]
MNPGKYPTDRAKVAYIISLLSGPALQWADALWQQNSAVTQAYAPFTRHFQEVFGIPPGDTTTQERLFRLRQGRTPINEHVLLFRTLAAASGWNETALLTHFRMSLEPSLRLQLSSQDDTIGLEKFIQTTIQPLRAQNPCRWILYALPPLSAVDASRMVFVFTVARLAIVLTPATFGPHILGHGPPRLRVRGELHLRLPKAPPSDQMSSLPVSPQHPDHHRQKTFSTIHSLTDPTFMSWCRLPPQRGNSTSGVGSLPGRCHSRTAVVGAACPHPFLENGRNSTVGFRLLSKLFSPTTTSH